MANLLDPLSTSILTVAIFCLHILKQISTRVFLLLSIGFCTTSARKMHAKWHPTYPKLWNLKSNKWIKKQYSICHEISRAAKKSSNLITLETWCKIQNRIEFVPTYKSETLEDDPGDRLRISIMNSVNITSLLLKRYRGCPNKSSFQIEVLHISDFRQNYWELSSNLKPLTWVLNNQTMWYLFAVGISQFNFEIIGKTAIVDQSM